MVYNIIIKINRLEEDIMKEEKKYTNEVNVSPRVFNKKRKFKLIKRARTVIIVGGLVFTSVVAFKIGEKHEKANDVEIPVSDVVNDVRDETVFDEIVDNENIDLSSMEETYAKVVTYGKVNKHDVTELEELGKLALKSCMLDALGLDASYYGKVVVQPSNVGNNGINPNDREDPLYCVVSVDNQYYKFYEKDGLFSENSGYMLAQDIYWLQNVKKSLVGLNEDIELNSDGMKKMVEFMDLTREVISNSSTLNGSKVVFHK